MDQQPGFNVERDFKEKIAHRQAVLQENALCWASTLYFGIRTQPLSRQEFPLLSIQAAACLKVHEPLPRGGEVKSFQVSHPDLPWPWCHQPGEQITELSHLL